MNCIILFFVGVACVLCKFETGLDQSVTILVVGSKSEITQQKVRKIRESVTADCRKDRLYCQVIDLANDFPKRKGTWTVFSALINPKDYGEISDWTLIVDEDSEVRMLNYRKFVGLKDPNSLQFHGFGLMDRRPTIIHHFGYNLDDDFQYPLFSAGALISRKVVQKLIDNQENFKMQNFAIDAKHEFAVSLLRVANVTLESHPEAFCKKDGALSNKCFVVAKEKFEETKTLEDEDIHVMIKTHRGNHKTRIPAMQSTWAHSLPLLDFCSDVADSNIPTIDMGVGNSEKGHCMKTWAILRKFNASSKAEWLLIADDDTLVSWNRLKELLANYNPKQEVIIGERYGFGFNFDGTDGYDYPTGGSGMVLSKPAVETVLSRCPKCASEVSPDDMMIGLCASADQIPIIHSNRLHQARPQDYSEDYIVSPISFHKFEEIDPIEVYKKYLQEGGEDEKGKYDFKSEL